MNAAGLGFPPKESPDGLESLITTGPNALPDSKVSTRKWIASDGHEAVLVIAMQYPPGLPPRGGVVGIFGASRVACREGVAPGVAEYGQN
jgi:hypothetical protein